MESYRVSNTPNICPILEIREVHKNTPNGGVILIRQYVYFNLKERIASMPYLTNIEKKWICFQILCAVEQLHSKGYCHGDLKLENILLSSNSSVFLSDIAPHKPAFVQKDELGTLTYYFGVSSNKAIYFAPERLVDSSVLEQIDSENNNRLSTSMDVFSLGCILAEIFIEDFIFHYPKLLEYKKGTLSLAALLSRISDPKLKDLLMKMLSLNPKERPSISEILQEFSSQIAPISFSKFFIQMNSLIVSSVYWQPDMRIGLVYKHWKQIYRLIYGIDAQCPELKETLNFYITNQLILDSAFERQFTTECWISVKDNENLTCMDYLRKDPNIATKNRNSESALIIINWILPALSCTMFPSSKIAGIEMLKILIMKFTDLNKIQRVLPYLTKLLADQNNLVRITALREILFILNSIIDDLILPSSDFNFFESYVFPFIEELIKTKDPLLMLEFTNAIDALAELELKFLQITLRSKFYELKHAGENNYSKSYKSKVGLNTKSEEYLNNYDQTAYEFKTKILKIIEDILPETSKEIQISLIQKLPTLMLFTGRKESNNFSALIIAQFNKAEWQIHKEVFTVIPSLSLTLGSDTVNNMILPCIEQIIYKDLNELRHYELIRTYKDLLEMNCLETVKAIEFIKFLLPLLVHPNLWIRTELMDITIRVINKISPAEIHTYFRKDLLNYLKTPFPFINEKIVRTSLKSHVPRILFEMAKHRIDYSFPVEPRDQDSLDMIREIFQYSQLEKPPHTGSLIDRVKVQIEPESLASVIREEFYSYLERYHNDDMMFIEKTFLGKLISASKIINSLQFSDPMKSTEFPQDNDNLVSLDYFRLKYLIKVLDIILSEEILEDERFSLSAYENQMRVNSIRENVKKVVQSIYTWRPQGKLLTTAYEQDNLGIDKILPISNILESSYSQPSTTANNFITFSNQGKISLWSILNINDSEYTIDKASSLACNDGIEYKLAQMLDQNSFTIARKDKKIELYHIESSRSDMKVNRIWTTNEQEGRISSILAVSNSQAYDLQLQSSPLMKSILYTTKNHLNQVDTRGPVIALQAELRKESGVVSCMETSRDRNYLFMGTYGGYVLQFDFRINTIINTWRYDENSPITSIQNYFNVSKDLDAVLNQKNNYLVITSGSDHEVGFWNANNLNCDLLLKVNTVEGNEMVPLITEIPYIFENFNDFDSSVDSMSRMIFNHKSLKNYSINREFYAQSNKRILRLKNIYQENNLVQTALSPLGLENSPYLITAGNDRTIRYWDLTRDMVKNSYLVSCPNRVNTCNFSSCSFGDTTILQSNEIILSNEPKKDTSYFSEYQNYNGITFHLTQKDEYDSSLEILKYSTKIADTAHKNIITDVKVIGLNSLGNFSLGMLSTSWDGTIKMWK